MNKRLTFLCVFVGLMLSPVVSVKASSVNEALWSAWGYTGKKDISSMGGAGEFIIEGNLTYSSKGTYGDEGAIVAVIAEQVVEHGAYLCPYQIQCANARKNKHSWTAYYRPNGFDDSRCSWFCERGYSGPGCEKQFYADTSRQDDIVSKLRSGVSRYASGNYRPADFKYQVAMFSSWNYYWYPGQYDDNGEHDILLGVIKFLQNGVIAAPIQVGCHWDNYGGGVDSWVARADLAGSGRKILCKQGYQPNDTNTDCVLATQEMLSTINPIFCGNFPESGFNSAIHRLVKSPSNPDCHIYVCKESGKAFPAAGVTDRCEDCALDIRGGPSSADGTCIRCDQLGQYFDSNDNTCKSAKGFSHTDMEFGDGKTKGDYKNKLNEQCWIKTSPDEYKNCVFGIEPEE